MYCDSVYARVMDPMYQINVYNPGSIGLNEITQDDVSLFPNPASTSIYINITTVFEDDVQISVANIAGQETNIILNLKNDLIEIELENISPGIYFVKLYDDVNSITKKFIKN